MDIGNNKKLTKNNIKLVTQTRNYNCGSACLAMILGTTVHVIETKYLKRRVGELIDIDPITKKRDVIGVSAYEMFCVMWETQHMCLFLRCDTFVYSDTKNSDWYTRCVKQLHSINFERRVNDHIGTNGMAILGVKSLKHKDGKHWIVASDGLLYDPAYAGDPKAVDIYSVRNFNTDRPLEVEEALLIKKVEV